MNLIFRSTLMHHSNRPRLIDVLTVVLGLFVLGCLGLTYRSYDAARSAAEQAGEALQVECEHWQALHVQRGIAYPHTDDGRPLGEPAVAGWGGDSDVEMTTGG